MLVLNFEIVAAAGERVAPLMVGVRESATILELKELIHSVTAIPVDNMMATGKGIQLEGDGTLGDWEVQDEDELGLYLRR